jgi:hypothetical protein
MKVHHERRSKGVFKRFSQLVKQEFSKNFNFDKKEIIDFTFQRIKLTPGSFADLGGVWGIDAAYTFYTIDRYNIKSAFLVDTDFTDAVMNKSYKYRNLVVIKGNFGDRAVLKQLGKVEAIFLFDVLLHQVKPDWDEILEIYSPVTNCFLVSNPQFIKSEKTIRLLDLGFDGYFENVPHDKEHPLYKELFKKMHDIHPKHNRIWRDIHNVWQWGITDNDLNTKMHNLGFKLQYYKNCGQWGHLKNFQNHVFVFQKSVDPTIV